MISVLGLSSRSCVGFHSGSRRSREPDLRDHATPISALTKVRHRHLPLVASGRVVNASSLKIASKATRGSHDHVNGADSMNDRGVAVGRAHDRTLAPEAIYRTFVLTPVQSERLGPVDPDPD